MIVYVLKPKYNTKGCQSPIQWNIGLLIEMEECWWLLLQLLRNGYLLNGFNCSKDDLFIISTPSGTLSSFAFG